MKPRYYMLEVLLYAMLGCGVGWSIENNQPAITMIAGVLILSGFVGAAVDYLRRKLGV